MPSSRAWRTHARAASSSTCEPWVSQLPYEMALIFRPLAPRLRISMPATLAPGADRPDGWQDEAVSSPTADVSVRVAWADDAAAIAALQLRSWPEQYGGLVPPESFPTRPRGGRRGRRRRGARRWPGPATRATACWSRSSATGSWASPSSARPSDPDCDPVADAELRELTVDPGERGRGPRLAPAAGRGRHAGRRPVHPRRAWAIATDDALRALPHRGRLGRRRRPPRARPRRHRRDRASSRSACTPPWSEPAPPLPCSPRRTTAPVRTEAGRGRVSSRS